MMCAPRGTLSGQLRLLVIISLGHFAWTWLHDIPPPSTPPSPLACLWITSSLTGSIELLQLQASPSGRKRKTSSTRCWWKFATFWPPTCLSLAVSLSLLPTLLLWQSVCLLWSKARLKSVWNRSTALNRNRHVAWQTCQLQDYPHSYPACHPCPGSSTLPSTTSSSFLIAAVCWHFSPTRFGSSFFFQKFPQRAIFDQVHFS